MGVHHMKVSVALEWGVDPQLTVSETEAGIDVIADPGLSQEQVTAACASLDEHGPAVLRAWHEAVGLDPGGLR